LPNLGISINTNDVNFRSYKFSNDTLTSLLLQGEIDTKTDESDFTTLQGIVTAFETAYGAFSRAQTAYNFANET